MRGNVYIIYNQTFCAKGSLFRYLSYSYQSLQLGKIGKMTQKKFEEWLETTNQEIACIQVNIQKLSQNRENITVSCQNCWQVNDVIRTTMKKQRWYTYIVGFFGSSDVARDQHSTSMA